MPHMNDTGATGPGDLTPPEPSPNRGLDQRLFVTLRTRWHPRSVERVVALFSVTGNWGLFWVALAAAMWLAGASYGRGMFLSVVVFIYLTLIVNFLVKVIVRRERPAAADELLRPLVDVPTSLSFPSSHAAMSFAAASVMSFYHPAMLPVFYILALVMSWTRVYVGVHYPSDVVAGTVVGLLAGGGAALFLNWV
jgi:undecaprenyl-diphosphatase